MTARSLRIVLSIMILLVIIAVIAGFVVAKTKLDDYATSISQLNADAQSGDSNIQTLRNVQTKLEQEKDTVAAARSVVAEEATYANTVINAVTSIAKQSGVSITSFEFVDSEAGAVPTTPTPVTPVQPSATSITPGVTKKSISVSLKSPLNYATLMNFIKGIETSSLKMQLTSVSLTKDASSQVATLPFIIEVYVRS